MEALRKKYTPINETQLKSGSIPNNGAEDEESFDHIALVDENGFERAAKQLFDPSRLQLTWKNIQPVGLGIQNLGNTCFLSSTLQALTYVPAFSQYLLSEQHGRSCKFHDFCVLCALEQHVKQALERVPDNTVDNSISPTKLVGKIRAIASTLKPGRQEDAHEFLRHLLQAAQKCCLDAHGMIDQRSQETTFLYQVFGGYLQSQIECFRCKNVTKSFEAFLDLSVDIHSGKSLSRALDEFTNFHQMSDDNKYHCETYVISRSFFIMQSPGPRLIEICPLSCDDKVTARKKLTVYKAPKTLTIHLKRFSFQDGHISKVDKMITYKEQLDIRPHMTEGQEKNVPGIYKLLAVIVHSGATTHSGHYVAYIKSSNGLWYCMNDTSVQQVSTQTVLNQKAYILFYGLEKSEMKNSTSKDTTDKKEPKKKTKKEAMLVQENDQTPVLDSSEVSDMLGVKISRKDFAKTASSVPQKPVIETKASPKMMTNKERKLLRKQKIEEARIACQQENAQASTEESKPDQGDLSGPSAEIEKAVHELNKVSKQAPEVDEDKLEEQNKLKAAISAAAALPTVASSTAVVVNYNDKMDDKRAKLDAVIQMEAAMGQSETVKKDIFGVGTRKGQFGTDAITRWDGDDMDIGTPVSEADREAALRRGQGRKKRVDAYDVDYDRGKVKKLKTKNTQRFEDTNKFQLQTDVENAVKANRFKPRPKDAKKPKKST
ncbi:hypothetical protein INT44_005008 [Umbelopsis vinacea]|uniref:Ubiquitin carboxyl-terminal hydrolase n=1 Tax=Umbelopsis vinacea TaxID=44442 RepID=A0A8H7Q7B4_9FUNG|nr:hypothetical protein INT44_005008 [Umbelopsis vinacea]